MNTVRRLLLTWTLAVLPGSCLYKRNASASKPSFQFDAYFSAIIDTIVPADETPGAIELGIDVQLLARVNANDVYLANMTEALHFLHLSSRAGYQQDFDRLPLSMRTDILNEILSSKADKGKNARMQFADTRHKTITRFYTSEAVYEMLEYHPPSQGGYPDYAAPPVSPS